MLKYILIMFRAFLYKVKNRLDIVAFHLDCPKPACIREVSLIICEYVMKGSQVLMLNFADCPSNLAVKFFLYKKLAGLQSVHFRCVLIQALRIKLKYILIIFLNSTL
ncbi:hypothetical protein IPC705_27955 [Pseudomonas aeruginosa]|nr:hypothetical protein IPC705_27955 [Pseudomonas aeruginosa]